jgi:hypothetical protein
MLWVNFAVISPFSLSSARFTTFVTVGDKDRDHHQTGQQKKKKMKTAFATGESPETG